VPLKAGMSSKECRDRTGLSLGTCAEQYRLPARCLEHQWYYYPLMTKEEVLLFTQYDSAEDCGARFTFHTAFHDNAVPADLPQRQSVEVRAMAIYVESSMRGEMGYSEARNITYTKAATQLTLQRMLAEGAAQGLLTGAEVDQVANEATIHGVHMSQTSCLNVIQALCKKKGIRFDEMAWMPSGHRLGF